jgi:hypothetical protein
MYDKTHKSLSRSRAGGRGEEFGLIHSLCYGDEAVIRGVAFFPQTGMRSMSQGPGEPPLSFESGRRSRRKLSVFFQACQTTASGESD